MIDAVAVTGLGIAAPCGIGAAAFWQGLLSQPADGVRSMLDWDPSPWFDNPKDARRADPFAQYALAAATEALEQAGEFTVDPTRIGVLMGTGVGGITTNEEQIVLQHVKGSRRVSPFLVPMMMPNAATAAVSMRFGFQGPCETTVTACAAGTQAIANALHAIRAGRCDVVITGASEAPLTPTAIAGFSNMTALSKDGRSMPFDAERNGFVIAEGAGILVLERLDLAQARGAEILGLVVGGGSTADAHHITAPSPGGSGAIRCMEAALDNAGLTAADIVHVNAHGTSTSLNDMAEAKAMAEVFNDHAPPIVTSTKGVTGHALGAAGALEAAAVLLSMKHRLIPQTWGLDTPDPEMPKLDFVMGQAREWVPGPSMSNSFGFGGHNGTIILAPAP